MHAGTEGWRTVFFRFLISGAGNTAASYAVYLVLLQFLPYRLSYTLAYAAGILLAYLLYRFYVFRASGGRLGLLFVGMIYLLQYLGGLAVIHVWVEILGYSAFFAPLIAVAATIPVTFALNRLVFRKKNAHSA